MNMKKPKLMVSDYDTRLVRSSGRWPCSVCKTGVGSSSISCVFVNIECIRAAATRKGRLRSVTESVQVRLDHLPTSRIIVVSNESLEVVSKLCYLGDMISAAGGIEESIMARISCGWKKLRKFLLLLTFYLQSVFTAHKW